MRKLFRTTAFLFCAVTLCFCGNSKSKKEMKEESIEMKRGDLVCTMTTPELEKRKETVLASLRKQVLEKKELKDGFAFKFSGSDATIDELYEFIRTERGCCGFFTFSLSVSGDTSEAWLEMTGPAEAKEFIKSELEL